MFLCKKLYILLLVPVFVFSCANTEGAVERVLKNFSRARVEGDLAAYRKTVGAQLLVEAVQNRSFQERFLAKGESNRDEGVYFAEIFISSLNTAEHAITVTFLEKQASGSRSWSNEYTAALEYIDGAWRIIRISP